MHKRATVAHMHDLYSRCMCQLLSHLSHSQSFGYRTHHQALHDNKHDTLIGDYHSSGLQALSPMLSFGGNFSMINQQIKHTAQHEIPSVPEFGQVSHVMLHACAEEAH